MSSSRVSAPFLVDDPFIGHPLNPVPATISNTIAVSTAKVSVSTQYLQRANEIQGHAKFIDRMRDVAYLRPSCSDSDADEVVSQLH